MSRSRREPDPSLLRQVTEGIGVVAVGTMLFLVVAAVLAAAVNWAL